MNNHYDEQLSALLSGELSGDETREVVAHLRECGPCTSSLISVAVAHGALTAARRAQRASSSFVAPAPAPLPPVILPRRHSVRTWGAIAAALILIGGVVTALKAHSGSTPPVIAAVASLRHLDSPTTATGDVTVHLVAHELRMRVSTSGLPSAPPNHFYEVWLLAPRTNKMLPLGVLSTTGPSTYAISPSIMRQFSAVDISLQDNNGRPEHSKISVLRGTVSTVPV